MSYLRRTRLWRASLSPTADPTAGHRAPRRSSWPRSTGSSACEASRAPVASFRITRPLSMPPPDVRVVLNADEAARSAASARDRSRWSARNRVPDAGRGFRHEASILPLARAQSEGSLLLFDHLDSFRPPGDGPARLLLGHPNARAPTTASLPLRTSVGCLGDEPPASGSPRRTEGTVSDGDAARGALPGRSRSCIRRWKRSSRQGRCRRSLGTTRERAVPARADDRNRGRKRAQIGGHGRTSRDGPERGRANPFPTGTSIRPGACFERTTGRRRRRHATRLLEIGVLPEVPMVVLNQQPAPTSSSARRPDRLAHGIAGALLATPGDTRNGVRAKLRLCPTACPTGLKCPMTKPNEAGIIIRVSGVRVPPPASS